MSTFIENELAAKGVARVIVTLQDTGNSAVFQKKDLAAAFSSDEFTPDRAIARSMKARGVKSRPASQTAMRIFPNLGIIFGTVNAAGYAMLKADPTRVRDVSGAPEISLIRPTATTVVNSPHRITWGINAMQVDALWKQGLTGNGIFVAHLDTGADGKHPALRAAIREFQEFDELGFAVTPTPAAWDSDGHGTHTAGTIAGRQVKGVSIGVAPGADLFSGMVIEGGEAVARVLAGMDWAVASGVRVLSMSLGFRGYWTDFLAITQVLREKGVLPVIAVGNEGPGFSRSPGNYVEALSVGAYGKDKYVANFSGSQRFARPDNPTVPDLVGPGVDVVSAMLGGGYQSMNGSSMATPHIAGLAALLFEAKPVATVDEVENAIFTSCILPATMQSARAGRGTPNAKRALKILMS